MASPMPDLPLPSKLQGHCPLTGTNLHCLMIEARASKELIQCCYWQWNSMGDEPMTSESQVQCLNHYTTRPHKVVARKISHYSPTYT